MRLPPLVLAGGSDYHDGVGLCWIPGYRSVASLFFQGFPMMKRIAGVCRVQRVFAAAFLVVAALLAPTAARADELHTSDGKMYLGKLISQDDYVVVFDITKGGDTERKSFDRGAVANIILAPVPAPVVPAAPPPAETKDKADDASKIQVNTSREDFAYVVIPMHGTVGVEITTDLTRRSLEAAKKLNPSVIVLEITSPGGLVSEMFTLIDLLVEWQSTQDIPIVAIVKGEAYSAAAILAMTVKHVYMTPGSAMGAAMAINVGPMGINPVAEKFSSAFRAKSRTGCEFAGREPLIVEGMMDPDIELYIATNLEGKQVIFKGHGANAKADTKKWSVQPTVFKPKTKLLSLTPGEAIACNAITGQVNDYEALGEVLGLPGWKELAPAVRNLTKVHVDQIAINTKSYELLTKQIKTGISNFRQNSGYQLSSAETNVQSILTAVNKMERLAEKNAYIKMMVDRDFPEGLDNIRGQCDSIIGQIKNARIYQQQQRRR